MVELAKLSQLGLRDVWSHEASHFTLWLAQEENLTLLGEVVGIDFLAAQTEVNVGDFHVDILAEDANEKKIVIENQLEPTNHDHLGKLITYASGLGANTVIWIVSKAREEHEQAINWLNEHTTEDANFFLIEIELWRIGKSLPAPRFNIVAKPNDWAKSIRTSSGKISDLKLAQQAFWEKFIEYGSRQKSRYIKSWQKPAPQHWYNIRVGSSKAKISPSINTREDDVTVELYIYNDKALFKGLLYKKDIIEKDIGIELEWRELPERKASRILAHYNSDFQDPTQQQELIEWIYSTAESFAKVFSRYLK